MLAQCDAPRDWIADFSQCLYEWQGIEAGILALLAAGIGAYFLWLQVSQSDRIEAERLAREHSAVRATLPLTLSGLCETLREMLIALDATKRENNAAGAEDRFSPPQNPIEHVQELKAVIASTNDRGVIEPIAEIIREMQLLWARVDFLRGRERHNRAGLDRELNGHILQAAKTYALIESLFEYARAEAQAGPSHVPWARAESIIFHLRIENAELVEMIRDSLKHSPSFWTLK